MIDKLRAEALALPAAERAELAHALLESLYELDGLELESLHELESLAELGSLIAVDPPDPPSAWLEELDRREEADRRRAPPRGLELPGLRASTKATE